MSLLILNENFNKNYDYERAYRGAKITLSEEEIILRVPEISAVTSPV
jgi:hypothetical protein